MLAPLWSSLLSFLKIRNIKDDFSNGDEKAEQPSSAPSLRSAAPHRPPPPPPGFVTVFLEQEGKSFICRRVFLALNDVVGGSGSMFLFYVIFYPLLLWGRVTVFEFGVRCVGDGVPLERSERCEQMFHPRV